MKKLRVIHIPQVGEKPTMIINVQNLNEAIKIADVLAYYDLMQYEENIKGDYSNATFLEEYDDELEDWVDYYSDNGESFDELRANRGFVLYSKNDSEWTFELNDDRGFVLYSKNDSEWTLL